MLCKNTVSNSVSLEVYTHFDFQPVTYSVPPCLLLTLTYQVFVDIQTYFENHHHQKNIYQEKNSSQMFLVFLFFPIFDGPM